jgi:SH3 domain protein
VKKIFRLTCLCFALYGTAHADIVYVTDDFNLALRDTASTHGKVLQSLPTGAALTLIGEPTRSGFIRVRLSNGTEGYIKTRYTKKEPPEYDATDTSGKNIALLQTENAALRTELKAAKDAVNPDTPLEQSLASERDKLSKELNELKKTAGASVQLKNERDELQERVVNVERELQQLKLENQALKDTTHQDWFLYGGILALLGVLLGFILPKLSWRRRSSWDSY